MTSLAILALVAAMHAAATAPAMTAPAMTLADAALADSLLLAAQEFALASPAQHRARRERAVEATHNRLRGYLDDRGRPLADLSRVLLRNHYHRYKFEVPGNERILPHAIADLNHARLCDPTFLPAHLGLGILYYQSGQHARAIAHLEFIRSVVADGQPGDDPAAEAIAGECCQMLAWCYRESGAWEAGLAVADQGLRLRPDDVALHVVKGLLLAGAGRVTEAGAYAERMPLVLVPHHAPRAGMLIERPSRFAMDWIRSQAALADGHPERARTILAKNIEARHDWDYLPFSRQYWNDVGLVYELAGSADATFYYEQALRGARYGPLQPTPAFTSSSLFAGLPADQVPFFLAGDEAYFAGSPFAYVARQVATLEVSPGTADGERARQRGLAMVSRLEARNIRPDFCHAVRGRIALRDGDLPTAVSELLAARDLLRQAGRTDLMTTLLLAQASLLTGEEDAAADYFREVLAETPDSGLAWRGLGVSLASTGQLDRALEVMGTGLQRDSRSVAGWYNRGLLLYTVGRFDEAERDFLRAREIAPDKPEIVTMLQAVNLARRGDRLRVE